MHSRLFKCLALAGMLVTTFAGFQSSRAQSAADEKEKPAVYTYVAQWAVARANWPAMEKIDATQKQIFEKLFADGTIIAYGRYRVVSHEEGRPTHGDWWTATSMANLLKALSAVSGQSAASDQNKVLGESKHWDLILTSKQYGGHSGTVENGYLRVGTYTAKPGQGEMLSTAIKAYMVPILDKLVADGAIHNYTIDREAIHSSDPATVDVAIVTNDADGLDKFMAALDSAGKANPLGAPAFGNATDGSLHRDFLAVASETSK